MECPQCGNNVFMVIGGVCKKCRAENLESQRRIAELVHLGHTNHCAARQVWGDGECECKGELYGPKNSVR